MRCRQCCIACLYVQCQCKWSFTSSEAAIAATSTTSTLPAFLHSSPHVMRWRLWPRFRLLVYLQATLATCTWNNYALMDHHAWPFILTFHLWPWPHSCSVAMETRICLWSSACTLSEPFTVAGGGGGGASWCRDVEGRGGSQFNINLSGFQSPQIYKYQFRDISYLFLFAYNLFT